MSSPSDLSGEMSASPSPIEVGAPGNPFEDGEPSLFWSAAVFVVATIGNVS